MLILTRENLPAYLRAHNPSFVEEGPLEIRIIGEQEEDSAGLINDIFQVSSPKRSIIVKQGQENIRSARESSYRLPPSRNQLEAASLRLRRAIVPQYVPEVYWVDRENNVFAMEDVSYLHPCRSGLARGQIFPELGRNCGVFMASIAFFTSEFYLSREKFRQLAQTFTNNGMRRVMEEWSMLHRSPFPPAPETMHLRAGLEEPAVQTETYLLRHRYMSHGEALIHSDLHPGNIFIDGDRMKVIDMEYTFAGPCAYDLGYFLGNTLSVYAASFFHPLSGPDEEERFRRYLLDTIEELFRSYRRTFGALWDGYAKAEYRQQQGFRERFLDGLLTDAVGYAALISLTLAIHGSDVAEFKIISDPVARHHAMQLYYATAKSLLLTRNSLTSVSELLSRVQTCAKLYLTRQLGIRPPILR